MKLSEFIKSKQGLLSHDELVCIVLELCARLEGDEDSIEKVVDRPAPTRPCTCPRKIIRGKEVLADHWEGCPMSPNRQEE